MPKKKENPKIRLDFFEISPPGVRAHHRWGLPDCMGLTPCAYSHKRPLRPRADANGFPAIWLFFLTLVLARRCVKNSQPQIRDMASYMKKSQPQNCDAKNSRIFQYSPQTSPDIYQERFPTTAVSQKISTTKLKLTTRENSRPENNRCRNIAAINLLWLLTSKAMSQFCGCEYSQPAFCSTGFYTPRRRSAFEQGPPTQK